MSTEPIYLDYNATTPVLPEVVDAMLPALREHFGNPSSGHLFGTRAKALVERARAEVAQLIGARDDEVFFTSGGTEANNLAIFGSSERAAHRRHVVTTCIEHPATEQPCQRLERNGRRVTRLPVGPRGAVDLGAADAIDDDTFLVTVMHSNNETGVLQPVPELAARAHDRGALVHTDAAQSLGKVPVDVDELGVDLLSIAGHKLYAPKGVGALFVRRGAAIAPVLLGAGHERGLRPGTENVASIVGLGAACRAARRDLARVAPELRRLRGHLLEGLTLAVAGLEVNGDPEHALPNTLNVRFPGVLGSRLLALAPEIAASTGSACHDGGESASRVILALGVSPEAALGSVRLSLGRHSTDADVTLATQALARAHAELTRGR